MDSSAYIKSDLESHHQMNDECWRVLLMTKHKTVQWQKAEEQETEYAPWNTLESF